jgi:hypothetical protein
MLVVFIQIVDDESGMEKYMWLIFEPHTDKHCPQKHWIPVSNWTVSLRL